MLIQTKTAEPTIVNGINVATARAAERMSDGATQCGRLTYSATASAKIALPRCVCKYQSVKRKT
jgi:hypothetical protein